MMNKKRLLILSLILFLSLFLNHIKFGNSNSIVSNYEIIKEFQHKQRKNKSAKVLADYMYERIKFYQSFDTWYERHYAIEIMYQALQNME